MKLKTNLGLVAIFTGLVIFIGLVIGWCAHRDSKLMSVNYCFDSFGSYYVCER